MITTLRKLQDIEQAVTEAYPFEVPEADSEYMLGRVWARRFLEAAKHLRERGVFGLPEVGVEPSDPTNPEIDGA